MFINDDGIRLNAKLDRPAGAERCPLVIFIHGFTGHIEERHVVAVCETLNAAGFATLRADMYGHGHSEGEFRKHTLYKWLTNVMTLVDYAKNLDFVTDLYLCGHSQGGLTAILAAALERDVISGLIALAPATMIPEIARRGQILGVSFDPERIPAAVESWDGRLLDGNYIRVAQSIDVEAAIDKYKGPVLIVHGDADEAVPVQCAYDAAERYENAKLVIIPGDTHCFDNHLDRVLAAVREWIAPRLGAE